MSNFKSTLIAYDEWLPDGLFKKLTLPEGINKKTLTNVIMLECGEMCPVWTNPLFMQEMIGIWSNKWQPTFRRWIEAMNKQYDPLNNYDRYESYTENNRGKTSNKLDGTDRTVSDRSIDTTTSGTDTDKVTGTETTKMSGTDTTVTDHDTTVTSSGTTTNSRSAFDQSGFSDHDKSVTSGSDTTADDSTVTLTHNTTDTLTHNTTDTLTRSGSESVDDDATINRTLSNTENGTDEHERTYTAHMYGNIGVMTSQQMLQAEYDIALWNIYEHIKDLFMQEFCIAVY